MVKLGGRDWTKPQEAPVTKLNVNGVNTVFPETAEGVKPPAAKPLVVTIDFSLRGPYLTPKAMSELNRRIEERLQATGRKAKNVQATIAVTVVVKEV